MKNYVFNLILFFYVIFPPQNMLLELSTDQLLTYIYNAKIAVQFLVLTNLDPQLIVLYHDG